MGAIEVAIASLVVLGLGFASAQVAYFRHRDKVLGSLVRDMRSLRRRAIQSEKVAARGAVSVSKQFPRQAARPRLRGESRNLFDPMPPEVVAALREAFADVEGRTTIRVDHAEGQPIRGLWNHELGGHTNSFMLTDDGHVVQMSWARNWEDIAASERAVGDSGATRSSALKPHLV